jgi:predicted amidohydrolase
MKISIVQLNSGPDISENLEKVIYFSKQAQKAKVSLCAFPENALFFNDGSQNSFEKSKILSTQTLEILKREVRNLKTNILIGSVLWPATNQKVFNRSILISSKGRVEATYDKVNLFNARIGNQNYKESRSVQAGKKTNSFRLGKIKFGMSICFDIRFPEFFINRKPHPEVFFIPSAFTKLTGLAHWDVLTRARALDTFSYVVAPAQWGKCGTRETYGHSRIVSPWGKVLCEINRGEGLRSAEVSKEFVEECRSKIPLYAPRLPSDRKI